MTILVSAILSTSSVGVDFVKISKVVCAASQSTISFSSIPGTYTNLMIVLSGRDTNTAVAGSNVRIEMNGDTTSGNYTAEQFHEEVVTTNNGGNNAATSAGTVCARIPGSLNNSSAVGSATIFLPDYAGTTFFKTGHGVYGFYASNTSPPLDAGNDFFCWKSTSAITSLLLTAGGTAFVNGTTATLYGLS